jgi:SAM-dependent methyltransferase
MTADFPVALVCPACKGALAHAADRLACASCRRDYPIVLGIPDLRLAPDPWISLEDDREKGRRLEATTRGLGLAETTRAYWAMTPTTASDAAEGFVAHVLAAPARTGEWLRQTGLVAAAPPGPWLDLGCGTADLAAAAPDGATVVGIDVAFRWLVVARKRLAETGRPAWLVCCNAEHLPFADGVFARALSLGMLEHCADPAPVLREARRVLQAGGQLATRSTNRYSLLPEPHVGLWGVGFVPRRWQDGFVRRWRPQGYRHHRPTSPRELRRAARQAGLGRFDLRAAALLAHDRARLPGALAWAARAYGTLARLPVSRRLLSWVAPAVDATGEAA